MCSNPSALTGPYGLFLNNKLFSPSGEISILCRYFYRGRIRVHCMFRQFSQSLSSSFCRKLFLSFVTVLQKFDYLYKDPGCPRILLTQDTVGAATEPVLIVTEAIAACRAFFKPCRQVCIQICWNGVLLRLYHISCSLF